MYRNLYIKSKSIQQNLYVLVTLSRFLVTQHWQVDWVRDNGRRRYTKILDEEETRQRASTPSAISNLVIANTCSKNMKPLTWPRKLNLQKVMLQYFNTRGIWERTVFVGSSLLEHPRVPKQSSLSPFNVHSSISITWRCVWSYICVWSAMRIGTNQHCTELH